MCERRTLYLVMSMKAYRSDVWCKEPEIMFAHPFKAGHTLVVEGDRGWDIGVVQMITYDRAAADSYSDVLNRRHMQDLLKYSRNYDLVRNPPKIHVGGDKFEGRHHIIRHAEDMETRWLRDKEHLEARMTRAVQKMANSMSIPMEVLDVDMQA